MITPRCDKHQTHLDDCAICVRMHVEQDIVTRLVDALLAASFKLNIDNGGDTCELKHASRDRVAILAALGNTDDEKIEVYASALNDDNDPETPSRLRYIGWIRLVYGNDGPDVICDYTGNLEPVLAPVNEYADSLS